VALLVLKPMEYQTALGPGAIGGGFDATAWGGFDATPGGGTWAQAPSKEMALTKAKWRHAIVRLDICFSIFVWVCACEPHGKQLPNAGISSETTQHRAGGTSLFRSVYGSPNVEISRNDIVDLK
jgi:hypothetical protein